MYILYSTSYIYQHILASVDIPDIFMWIHFEYRSYIYIFFEFLADTCPFWDHWYPCFEFLVMLPLGFKARVGSALFTYCRGKCNVHSPRSTSGATHADLLAASIIISPVPTYCCRGEVAGIQTRALRISVSHALCQLS